MARGKDLTLMMWIRARGDEARRMLGLIEKDLGRIQKLGHASGHAFRGIGWVGGAALKPLQWAGKAALGLGAGIAAGGAAAVKAAASDEALRSRLEGLYGSAEKARSVFEELEAMSLRSPLSTDQLVEAQIVLEQFGLAGKRNLKFLGAAARVSGQEVNQLAMAVGTLQQRQLKWVGIDVDTKGDQWVIKWRDRANQAREYVANSLTEAQNQVLRALAVKFGENISPKSFGGRLQMLRNNIEQAFAGIGDALLPKLSELAEKFADWIRNAIESGKIDEWAEKIRAKLTEAFTYGKTVFEHARGLMESWLGGNAEQRAEAFAAVAGGIGEMIAVAFVNYLAAVGSVFRGLGAIIGSGFLQTVLGSELPGASHVLRNTAAREAQRMVAQEGWFGINKIIPGFSKMVFDMQKKTGEELMSSIFLAMSEVPKEQQLAVVREVPGRMMAEGLNTFRKDLPGIVVETGGALKEIARRTTGQVEAALGYTGPTFAERLAANQGAMGGTPAAATAAAAAQDQVGIAYPMYMPGGTQTPPHWGWSKSYARSEPWQYSVGERLPGGGIVIQVNEMQIEAANLRQMQREIINEALRPRVSRASGR